MTFGRFAYGCFSLISTVCGSFATTFLTGAHIASCGLADFGLMIAVKTAATDAAVTGAPEWNFAPFLILSVQVFPLFFVDQPVASCGTNLAFWSSVIAASYRAKKPGSYQLVLIGSMREKSRSYPSRRVPPFVTAGTLTCVVASPRRDAAELFEARRPPITGSERPRAVALATNCR